MTAIVEFTVPGIPRPEGSTRAFVVGGKARVTHDNPKLRSWRADVRCEALRAYSGDLVTYPVVLSVRFILPRPKGHYGTGKNASCVKDGAPKWPTTKPDLDKLVRGCSDALTGAIWRDDSQVTCVLAWKEYGARPETIVTVRENKA